MNGFFVHGLVDWLLVEKVGQTPTDLPADISWLFYLVPWRSAIFAANKDSVSFFKCHAHEL
jgi:hypothetical protein